MLIQQLSHEDGLSLSLFPFPSLSSPTPLSFSSLSPLSHLSSLSLSSCSQAKLRTLV